MSQRRNNLKLKTAVFIGLSTVLHAGFIIYVAASNYGSDLPPEVVPSSGSSVVVDILPTEKSAEPVAVAPAPAPKIVIEKPKDTKLPEKSQAMIAKSEETVETPVVVENPESVPVPVAAITEEKQAEEKLVEQIQNDVVTPVPDATTEAAAVVPDPVPSETAAPALVESAAPVAAAPIAEAAPAGNSNVATESVAAVLPVRQHSELKAMPGNQDPRYSVDDRLAKREGEIKFLAEVTPEGNVTNVRMLKSTGHKSLDMAALKSFKNYRYQPGQQGYVLKSFNFALKGHAQLLPSRLADRTKASGSLAE